MEALSLGWGVLRGPLGGTISAFDWDITVTVESASAAGGRVVVACSGCC